MAMVPFLKKIYFFLKGNYTSFDNVLSKYVSYKIVDFRKGKYIVQCVNTKSTFQTSISDIIFDLDILYSLHPLQSCYIGIEFAFYLKKNNLDVSKYQKRIKKAHHDYGIYRIKYQDRKGDYCYVDLLSYEENVEDPREIAFSEIKISKFSAEEAFYIGLNAGLKIIDKYFNATKKANVIPFKKVY